MIYIIMTVPTSRKAQYCGPSVGGVVISRLLFVRFHPNTRVQVKRVMAIEMTVPVRGLFILRDK